VISALKGSTGVNYEFLKLIVLVFSDAVTRLTLGSLLAYYWGIGSIYRLLAGLYALVKFFAILLF
jgi:hypothetical protein